MASLGYRKTRIHPVVCADLRVMGNFRNGNSAGKLAQSGYREVNSQRSPGKEMGHSHHKSDQRFRSLRVEIVCQATLLLIVSNRLCAAVLEMLKNPSI